MLFPQYTPGSQVINLCEFQAALAAAPSALNASASGGGTASSGGGLSGGAIAGIVLGSLAGLCLLALLAAYVRWRRRWVAQQRRQLEAMAEVAAKDAPEPFDMHMHGYGDGEGDEEAPPLGDSSGEPMAVAADGMVVSGAGRAVAPEEGGWDKPVPQRLNELQLISRFLTTVSGSCCRAREATVCLDPCRVVRPGALSSPCWVRPAQAHAQRCCMCRCWQPSTAAGPARPPCLQFGRGNAMASLSQRSSQESGSRRRAGFSMAKTGAGQDHSNATTDLTKLPAGFLEGEAPPGAGLVQGMCAAAVAAGGAARLAPSKPGRVHQCWWPCALPAPCCSVPLRHQAGGVRGGGVVWRGEPSTASAAGRYRCSPPLAVYPLFRLAHPSLLIQGTLRRQRRTCLLLAAVAASAPCRPACHAAPSCRCGWPSTAAHW